MSGDSSMKATIVGGLIAGLSTVVATIAPMYMFNQSEDPQPERHHTSRRGSQEWRMGAGPHFGSRGPRAEQATTAESKPAVGDSETPETPEPAIEVAEEETVSTPNIESQDQERDIPKRPSFGGFGKSRFAGRRGNSGRDVREPKDSGLKPDTEATTDAELEADDFGPPVRSAKVEVPKSRRGR